MTDVRDLYGLALERFVTERGRLAKSATLHAAALAEDAREKVRHGCLERELRYVGFGATETASAAAQRPAKPSTAKARSGVKRDAKGRAQAERAEQKRGRRVRAEQLSRAGKAEADARRGAERAEAELQAAQARRDQVAIELRAAEGALHEARRQLKQATRAHRFTRQALDVADEQ